MKNVSASGIVALTLMAAACSMAGCQGTSTQQQPAYPPGNGPYPGYAPQAYPQPGYAPQPGYPSAPGLAPMQVAPGLASFPEVINLAQIQALTARNPKACGFVQVAPNVWTRVDCQAYAPSQKAVAHLSPRKALALSNHTTQWKPLSVFGATIQQALAQGFSKGIFQRPTAGTQQGVTAAAGPPVIVADAVPATVDHRQQNLEGPIKDQGPVGACTAFSLSTSIDNAAIRAGKMVAGQAGQASSANHVWAGYGYPQMGRAADATTNRAIAPMSLWGQSHSESCEIADPIIGDCEDAVTPRVKAGSWRQDKALVAKSDRANAGGLYKVVGYDRVVDVANNVPLNIDSITQTLATGADLWVAFRIDGFAWSKVKNGVIPDWSEPNGGHAVTMAGYRTTAQGRQYLLHNNWGVSWGEGGYGWVSEAMVTRWMNFAYKVRLADGVKTADLTDDDCGADEMVDVATGRCAGICPDNSRPNNGCSGAPAAPSIPGLPPGTFPTIPGLPQIPGFPQNFPQGFPQIPGLPNFGR